MRSLRALDRVRKPWGGIERVATALEAVLELAKVSALRWRGDSEIQRS